MPSQQHPTDVETKNPSTKRSTGSKPINAIWARRFGTLAAVALFKRVCPHKGTILVISRRLCIKYEDRVDLSEASAMHFMLTIYTSGRRFVLQRLMRGDGEALTLEQPSLVQFKNMASLQARRHILPLLS